MDMQWKRPFSAARFSLLIASALTLGLGACSSGGGGVTPVAPPAPTSGPTATPVPASASVPVGTSSASSATVSAGSTKAVVTIPAASSGSGTVTITGSSGNPTNVPLSRARSASLRGTMAAAVTPLGCLALTPSVNFTFPGYPGFSVTLPSSMPTSGQNFYIAFYTADPAFHLTTWIEPAAGPASISGQTITFATTPANPALSLTAGQTYDFCLYEQAVATPTPSPTPTPTPVAAASVQTIDGSSGTARGTTIAGAGSAILVSLSGAGDAGSGTPAFSPTALRLGTGSAAQSVVVHEASSRTRVVTPLAPVEAHPADDRYVRTILSRMQRGSTPLRTQSGVRPASATFPVGATVGSTAYVWVSVFSIGSSGSFANVPATLEAQTTHGNIWVDSSLISGSSSSSSFNAGNAQTTAGQIARDFENAYASDTTHFATADYPDNAPGRSLTYNACDSNGNVIGQASPVIAEPSDHRIDVMILNTANLGQGVGGYFSGMNFVSQAALNCTNGPSTSSPLYSNEAPMIYLGWFDRSGSNYELNEDLVRGSAHEFQHLINFVNHSIIASNATTSNPLKGSEEAFINEGLSMLAQDIAISNLYGPSFPFDSLDALGHAATYLSNPQNYSVSGFIGIDPSTWGGDGKTPRYNCGGGCYGSAYLFQRYMHDRFGGDVYTRGMETSGLSGFTNLTTNCGCGESGTQLLQDFALAMAVNTEQMTPPTQAYAFGSLDLMHGAYASPLTGYTASSLGGVAVFSLSTDQAISITAPVGGFSYTALTPAGGARFSITDTTPSVGYGMSGGLVQH